MSELRILAITVASGRVGYVFLIGGKLEGWGMSRKGSISPRDASSVAVAWIRKLRPIVVITEEVRPRSRKGAKTRNLIEAVAQVARESEVLDVRVAHRQAFANKYAEAKALADQFPELCPWVPKPRRIWDSEPRSMVYFEAMALAVDVLKNPSERLAAAMG